MQNTFNVSGLIFFSMLLIFTSHHAFCQVNATHSSDDPNQSAVLLIDDHQGLDETDVQNAALLVAKELRAQGITVSDPVHEVPVSATVYRVVLRRSGQKILFRLSHENSTGSIFIKREILLADIEDIVSSTPRLVLALVHRGAVILPTSFLDVGVGPLISPAGLSMGIGWSIDRLSYSVDVSGRFAVVGSAITYRSMSVGGRYYFRKQNRSPYVGGGLGVMHTKYELTSRVFLWERTYHLEEKIGIGAYGVLGIEFLRSSHDRLTLELRVDRPFFTLPSRDVMPITLGITFSTSRLFGGLGGCLPF